MEPKAIRTPRQRRSRDRVEGILDAARRLVRAHGAARVTMKAIAVEADATMASIYQYFPDKGSIVVALCDRALEANRQKMEAVLTPPLNTTDALLDAAVTLLWSYHRMLADDPVLRDIWSAYASDKALHDVERLDGSILVDLIPERADPLFVPDARAAARLAPSVLFTMCAAAVDSAFRQDREASVRIIEEAETILRTAWEARIAPLARKAID